MSVNPRKHIKATSGNSQDTTIQALDVASIQVSEWYSMVKTNQ
jgi:hypothetical protein